MLYQRVAAQTETPMKNLGRLHRLLFMREPKALRLIYLLPTRNNMPGLVLLHGKLVSTTAMLVG